MALRYQLTGNPEEATLFAALWDLYAKSAVADPRKYGGPWGFDSDFPSLQVVCGWAGMEYDPVLSDAERLAVTQSMGRWLAEAVVPKCMGAVSGSAVPHNHQTFPGLGALAAALYFTQGWDCAEGRTWLAAADKMFRRQAGFFKPYEDCNGYQWLTHGHLFRYAMARPDYGVFENGNGKRIVDYCIGTMNPLGYQVPYGDTGSWQCWNSEMSVLDMFSLATGDPAALWAAGYKRQVKGTAELYSFYRGAGGEVPQGYTGVQVWPLEPQFYQTFKPADGPAFERCFDKVTFRGAMDPAAPYLLLDGLSNGGHRHLDGNSIPQITQFGRIWLADNDYFKAQVKYHNSMLVFQDGQSGDIPPYAELRGAGSTDKYGYCRTRMADYAGVDWDRSVVWLRQQGGFVVLDRLTARQDSEYQFRLLWHGVGEATVNDDGMLLRQKGPTMRIQPIAGPELRLTDDSELGTNWSGYPFADPVVHSLGAVATVDLKAGATYLYATAIHGQAEGDAPAWHLDLVDGIESVLIQTDQGPIAVGLGPVDAPTPAGNFTSDAEAMVVDRQGVTFLGCRKAALGELTAHESAAPACVFVPFPDVEMALQNAPLRPPVTNLAPGGEAPAHAVEWEVRPAPERLVLSGNKGVPGAVDLGAKLASDPAPAEHNAFDAGAPNKPEALLDGQFGNSTTTSVMYEPDKLVTLTLDLGASCRVKSVRWHQWWSTTSSKNTKYLLGKAVVSASRDNFAADVQALGTVTDAGPHPNFGAPLEYRVDAPGGGVDARYVRLAIEPQPGSAVYLAELLVEGTPADPTVQAAPYHFKRVRPVHLTGREQPAEWLAATAEGVLLALKPDGSLLWRAEYPQAVNDLAAADFDRDGRDEVLVARQDNRATLLDDNGRELWTRELQYYRRPPYANVARAGDLDGDGVPEAVIGGENWRFYAFRADGTELWNYESVHPSRSGAVADLDGDGKCEVLCGTHYYWSSTLKGDGTLAWGYSFGPICYDIATGSFDRDKTRGVVYGGGDGLLHYVGPQGKARLRYNTGDEVRHVATGDLDGDGADEIVAGSMNFSVYCFGADGRRRWRHDLGDEVTALAVVGTTVVAGTAGGKLFRFDAAGSPLAMSKLGAAVLDVATDGTAALVATADGKLRRVVVR
ncbi:MAG: PQQ-binding-like beta-propeller repeat protein [Armatimonadetes bacterium]|nr:PQQ-binding-like beta-propeller repeat protein [Armatimonadota bacterium]